MKVKDLIKDLQQFNPENEILFGCSIECGYSVSVCNYTGEIYTNEYTNEEIKEEIEGEMDSDTEETYKEVLESLDGKGVCVINISGEETFCG